MQRFTSGSPIAFATAVPDGTGHITQTSTTQVTLAPGTYLITYHVSTAVERAGYLQVTPAYGGQGYLQYGVYGRVIDNNVTICGSSSFIVVVSEETVLTLNVNSDTTLRDGAMTMVILGLKTGEDD